MNFDKFVSSYYNEIVIYITSVIKRHYYKYTTYTDDIIHTTLELMLRSGLRKKKKDKTEWFKLLGQYINYAMLKLIEKEQKNNDVKRRLKDGYIQH